MKVCCKCKLSKPLEEFPINKTKKDGRSYKCKDCTNISNKEYYLANSDAYKRRSKSTTLRDKERLKRFKEGLKCEVCGESRWWVLDFHHKDSKEKKFNIGRGIAEFSFKKTMEEIKKCMVLCANCHRDLHYRENSN